jgi:hypothetical protein
VKHKSGHRERDSDHDSSGGERPPSHRDLSRQTRAGQARAGALAGWLGGCPRADEAILIASEFAANSVLHSASRDGGAFTLRAEISPDRLRIEVEDGGGPWRDGPRDDSRPHGLDVVTAIAGPGNWGIDGDARGRIAWAILGR